MTIKQELINLGMKENELDTHASDLYVLKNDISTKWVKNYRYNENITTFIDEIDKKVWYEIPFGYMHEYLINK